MVWSGGAGRGAVRRMTASWPGTVPRRQVRGLGRAHQADALEHVPADHGDQQHGAARDQAGRIALHLLKGDADRRLQRHRRIGALALEAFDRQLLVETQGGGVGAHIADREDAVGQDREIVLLEGGQVAAGHPRDAGQFGQRTARMVPRDPQAFAQSRSIRDGRDQVLPVSLRTILFRALARIQRHNARPHTRRRVIHARRTRTRPLYHIGMTV